MNVIKTFSNKSSTSLTGKEGYAVKFDTDGVNVPSAKTDRVIGIVTSGGASGGQSDVCVFGECTAKAGGTILAGQTIIPDTDGTVLATAASSQDFGIALEGGVDGDWINVFVIGAPKTNS
jgi:hypothetical protein